MHLTIRRAFELSAFFPFLTYTNEASIKKFNIHGWMMDDWMEELSVLLDEEEYLRNTR